MSTPITNYTDTDQIRGALGITDNEISDQMFKDQQLIIALESDLSSWIPTHETIYNAGINTAATDTQRLQSNYISLYSMWYGAAKAATMPLALPKSLGDGKSEITRFNIDLKELGAHAENKAAYYKNLLSASLGTSITATSVSIFGVSSPDYDPVTGP